ncbi:MAG: DUF5668 domain-containing protein [Candidatus Kapabacteria bacterium]|nr:DUF5668 domain-containing protein [Candidatus Kapabacteria bacterium]
MKARNILGGILIFFGILMLTAQLKIFSFPFDVIDLWPLIIIFFGIYEMFRKRNSFFGGLIIFSIGLIFLASSFDWLHGGFWSAFWPLLLVMIGIRLVYPQFYHREINLNKCRTTFQENLEDRINISTIFSSTKNDSKSPDFKGGSIAVVMGQSIIDLRASTLTPLGAFLEVSVVMGTVKMHIPNNWNLILSGTPVMGSVENRTFQVNAVNDSSPKLTIKYEVIMGEFVIYN